MKSASCECGYVATGELSADVAKDIRSHIEGVHPGKVVPEADEMTKCIGKAHVYAPSAGPVFLLYKSDDGAME